MIFTGWDTPLALVKAELVQKEYEGYPVPQSLKDQVAALDGEKDAMNFEAADILFEALDTLPKDPEFSYVQPNELVTVLHTTKKGAYGVGKFPYAAREWDS